MSRLAPVLAEIDASLEASISRLFELLRIRSISTDPAFSGACREAADWLAQDLSGFGFDASVRQTAGRPMVVAHHEGPRDAPHLLFYGHYDVQPVDPLELWDRDPFDPAIITRPDGRQVIAARGASDDKGQLMLFIEACRAWKKTHNSLPCRITMLFEGEEESGSPSLKPFLTANQEELRADLALVCDTGMWGNDTPAIATSLRGLVGEEVVVRGAERDLHSGHYGGAAANPIHVLNRILAALHDREGRVAIPGFYDGVAETPPEVLDSWKELEATGPDLLREVGLFNLAGESGRSVLEMIWARPTAEVNGISGGYTGEGFKTVIASEASAKVSFRLVGKQDPEAIRTAFRQFVRDRIPADCSVRFSEHGGSPAIQLPHDSPMVEKTVSALSSEWPRAAVTIGMGGSIPIVGDFKRLLGMESLLTGFAKDDDRIHSPNEKYDLTSFHKGQRSWARILDALTQAKDVHS